MLDHLTPTLIAEEIICFKFEGDRSKAIEIQSNDEINILITSTISYHHLYQNQFCYLFYY